MKVASHLAAAFLAAICIAGCAASAPEPEEQQPSAIAEALDAQPEDVQARYNQRHPKETLELFGIEPGMTVVEALPGGGWYSKIVLSVLGADGHLVGANYDGEIWPLFGFLNDEQLAAMAEWTTTWPEQARGWTDTGAEISAFTFGNLPEDNHGSADVVLFIRALHNMARFSDKSPFLDQSITDAWNVLKPGGVVGIVQHAAREDMPDAWANGSAGYLKKSFVIERMTAAGFELVEDSAINANDRDQPTAEDIVWRLPPSYRFAGKDPEKRAAMDAIGESNRMTLKFVKPVS